MRKRNAGLSPRKPADSVNEIAIRWAARTAYGALAPEDHAELDIWLATDRRHRGAYARARAGLLVMEDMVAAAPPVSSCINDNERALRGTRRSRAWWALPVAASGAVLLGVASLPWLRPSPVAPGKPIAIASARTMDLADGSVATLSHDARIAVDLGSATRRITLTAGEATFKVAKDPSRPFVVQSGDVFAQATGTVYSVSRVDATGGRVKVREGSVLVWSRDERDQAVLLHAGGELILNPGPPAPPGLMAARPLPPPQLAQISLDNVTLASAAERFNRVNDVKIVIADPALGEKRIVGLFAANDPEQFVRAVAAIHDADVTRNGSNIVIKMK